jgi:hypothetical protein
MRMSHPIVRTVVLGGLLGLVILGVGGRIVMAWIAADAGGTPRFTLGGTMTVVLLGAASGLAGGVMAVASRWLVGRVVPRHQWLEHVLLAAMLLLVTMRGLRGTQAGGWAFYLLVALYGVALAWLTSPRRPDPSTPSSDRSRSEKS